MTPPTQARIVILNYNGEEMLARCLPSIWEAVRHTKTPTAVTILDNLSTDRSEEYVRENYPGMEFVKAPENLVLCSYNDYLKKISEPVAILLNNDIRVDKDFIDPLVAKFDEDPGTFLVAPRVMSFDGKTLEAVDTRARMNFPALGSCICATLNPVLVDLWILLMHKFDFSINSLVNGHRERVSHCLSNHDWMMF